MIDSMVSSTLMHDLRCTLTSRSRQALGAVRQQSTTLLPSPESRPGDRRKTHSSICYFTVSSLLDGSVTSEEDQPAYCH